ncbi:hypothetical protein LCGC14_2899530 [marine sediment metagenome]|uniref:Lipoprotein n=1 Tax=marine sediment metagenome TaxID=412755 RepID=A0A0F8XUX4_9ZZZZ
MRKLWILPLVVLAALALACTPGERYPEGVSPHESWKPRSEYCFFVDIDPAGYSNSTYFWSDDVVVADEGGTAIVRATNVRTSSTTYNADTGNPKRDFYQATVVKIIADGQLDVNGRCPE